ncbi:MAG: helix-turn-helix transcriptional regulator [Rickettsiales bacterium]
MAKNDVQMKEIDRVIGMRIHELRLAMGLSRVQLATQIGVTHQQLQKYEKGMNRICVGRLIAISKALKKTPSYFFNGVEDEEGDSLPTQHQRMCIEVSRNFMRIESPTHQNAVNMLVRALADGGE